MKIVILGSGNVAYHLTKAFTEKNISIAQIFGRNEADLQAISKKFLIPFSTKEIEDADLKYYLLQNNVRKHLEKFQKTGLNPDELLEKYINEIISEFKVIAIQTKDTIFENDILQKNSEKYMTLPFITQDIQKN